MPSSSILQQPPVASCLFSLQYNARIARRSVFEQGEKTSSPNLRGGSYWLCWIARYFEFYFGFLLSPCRLFLSCLPLDLEQPLVSHGVAPPHPCSDLGADIDWETPFLLWIKRWGAFWDLLSPGFPPGTSVSGFLTSRLIHPEGHKEKCWWSQVWSLASVVGAGCFWGHSFGTLPKDV